MCKAALKTSPGPSFQFSEENNLRFKGAFFKKRQLGFFWTDCRAGRVISSFHLVNRFLFLGSLLLLGGDFPMMALHALLNLGVAVVKAIGIQEAGAIHLGSKKFSETGL